MKGIHSDWAYKQLEGSSDGIIDFRIDDVNGNIRDLFQIRTMRDVRFTRELAELRLGQHFEISLR